MDVYSASPWDAPYKRCLHLMPFLSSLALFSVLWTCIQPRPGTSHTNVDCIWCLICYLSPLSVCCGHAFSFICYLLPLSVCCGRVFSLTLGRLIQTLPAFYALFAGLILVIFLTEPVGLAPHNLTKPERKTMSPVKMLCQILQLYLPRFVKAANDYMM